MGPWPRCDVAQVATAIRRRPADGPRRRLLPVLASAQKRFGPRTPAIIAGIKQRIEEIRPTLLDNLKISLLGEINCCRSAARQPGVAREGAIAAMLTSLMILLFLGSWRSTLIIAISIPLAILGSIIALSAIGETLNIMTLGGLALAVGILVDDATVTIENINWHLEHGKGRGLHHAD